MRQYARDCISLVLLCSISACSTTQPTSVSNDRTPLVPFTMTEQAVDGNHPLITNQRAMVDANADMVIAFETVKKGEPLAPNPEWQRLKKLLGQTGDLMKSYAELSRVEVDPNQPQQVKNLKQRVRAHNQSLDELLSNPDVIEVLTKPGGDPRKPYEKLSQWLREEIERLEREAARTSARILADRQKLWITIQALHEPVVGTPKSLHVDDYDMISAGTLQPIDRFGLRLNPAERERLDTELRQTRAVAASLQSIQNHKDELKTRLALKLEQVGQSLRRARETLLSQSGNWDEQLGKLNEQLQTVSKTSGLDEDAKKAAKELADEFREFRKLFSNVQTLESSVKSAIGLLTRTSDEDDLSARVTDLATALANLRTNVQSLLSGFRDGRARLERIKQHIGVLAPKLADEALMRLLSDAEGWTRSFLDGNPEFAGLIAAVAEFIESKPEQALAVAAVLAKTEEQLIPRPADNAPAGRIELQRAGMTLGDHVTVKVKFSERDKDGKLATVEEHAFPTEATLMGLHRVIGADLIFARGFGSDQARQWKPNVAARADWHYRYRAPSSKFEEWWNLINPGLGLHAASLDQGPDNVEVGLGVNVSLWSGFLVGGYGQNLSTNRQYYFVGLNLLDVLNKAIQR